MNVLVPVAKLAVMLVMLGMSKILSKNTFFQNIKLLFKILNIILKPLKLSEFALYLAISNCSVISP